MQISFMENEMVKSHNAINPVMFCNMMDGF